MKCKTLLIALFVGVALMLPLTLLRPAVAADAVQIVVSPTGNDSAPGTVTQPLRTLEAAQQRVRALVSQGNPVSVLLRGGHYPRATPLTLTKEDSGRPGAPVTWQSYPGESAVLTGSVEVAPHAVRPVADAALLRAFPGHLRERVRQISLDEIGVTDLGTDAWMGPGNSTPAWPSISQAGVSAQLARYPNSAYLTITGSAGDATWRFADSRPFQWTATSQAWTFGYPGVDWGFQHTKVASLDPAGQSVILTHGSYYGVRHGQRFHFYNVPEELDLESEYFLDRARRNLYFVPNGQPVRVTSATQALVRVAGASHVNLTELHFAETRGNAVELQSGSHVTVKRGTFANVGLRAMLVGNVTNSGVVASRFTGLGAGGVQLGGGDRASLTPGRNFVRGSTFSHYSTRFTTYRGAVDLVGVGNVVANNEISQAPHLAISVTGNDHVVENNYIHDVVQDSSDAGAIYGGRDWSEMGTVIRNNIIANVGDRYGRSDNVAVYLDDMKGGVRIENNLIVNAPRGVQLSGAATTVHSNTFLNTDIAVHVGAWGAQSAIPGGDLDKNLAKVDWRSDPWKKYGSVLADYSTRSFPERSYPVGNSITSNAFDKGGLTITPLARNSVLAHNVQVATDAVSLDPRVGHRIASDSPILLIPGHTGINADVVGVDAADSPAPVSPGPAPTNQPPVTTIPSPSSSSIPLPGTGPRMVARVSGTNGAPFVQSGHPVTVSLAYAGLDAMSDYRVEIAVVEIGTQRPLASSVQALRTRAAREGSLDVEVPTTVGTVGTDLRANFTLRHAVGHVVSSGVSANVVRIEGNAPPTSTVGATPSPTVSSPVTNLPTVSMSPAPIPPSSTPVPPSLTPTFSTPEGTGPRASVALGHGAHIVSDSVPRGQSIRVTVAYAGMDTFTDYGVHITVTDLATHRVLHRTVPVLKTLQTRSGSLVVDVPPEQQWAGTTVGVSVTVQHPMGHVAATTRGAHGIVVWPI